MAYFDEVKLEDEVYSLIYGNGTVKFVLPKAHRTKGFFMFQVHFAKAKVHYNEDGVPEWCNGIVCEQTAYYKDDVFRPESDYATIDKELLSLKKAIKLKDQGLLEMRTPSGAWRNVDLCPAKEYLRAIKHEELYLFRKARDN